MRHRFEPVEPVEPVDDLNYGGPMVLPVRVGRPFRGEVEGRILRDRLAAMAARTRAARRKGELKCCVEGQS
jgi:hypothetical protein